MGDDSRGTSRIALTGATGFIGFQLQRRLAADGFTVRALVRPGSRYRDRVAEGVEVSDVALDDGPGLSAAFAKLRFGARFFVAHEVALPCFRPRGQS